VGGNQLGTQGVNQARKASLGESLIAARRRRGLSRDALVQQSHIPAHYVQMLEDDDYHRISDQLYLLPFLRKYASFLEIDQDESAIHLLCEVQRADNNPSPLGLEEPLDDIRCYRRRDWGKPILFGSLIAVIVGAYIVQSRNSDTEARGAPQLQTSREINSPSSSYGGGEMTTNPPLSAQSAGGTVSESTAGVLQQNAFETRTHPSTESLGRLITIPARNWDEPSNRPQRNITGGRQAQSR
jgi:cytoskeletal protein RodZ